MPIIPTPPEAKQIPDYTVGVFDGASLLYQSKGGTGYKVSGDDVADYVTATKTYPSIGGVSLLEGIGKPLTATLTAGQTSLTFSDVAIETTSMIDVYVDDSFYGVSPSAVSVVTGSVTLTFDAQLSDMPVRIVVR